MTDHPKCPLGSFIFPLPFHTNKAFHGFYNHGVYDSHELLQQKGHREVLFVDDVIEEQKLV